MEQCFQHSSKFLHFLEIVQVHDISRRAQVSVMKHNASVVTRCARGKHVRTMSSVIR